MAEVKLTKNELRFQQLRLNQLMKYLPTLKLKKALLQIEVNEARLEIAAAEKAFQESQSQVEGYSALMTEKLSINLTESAKVLKVHKRYENIAGTEVPYFDGIDFADFSYSLFDTPAWVDNVTKGLRSLAESQVRVRIAEEKAHALEKELREVSIRVNLFEKILIPRAQNNIKKIKVFLGDQQLAAVSQAKVAKAKIEEQKAERECEICATT